MPDNEEEARARYRYLQLKQKAALANTAPNEPRKAADMGEALMTDLPAEGILQHTVRGLPATAYATAGGGLGMMLGGPPGAIIGAGLGGLVGEGVRQAVTHGVAAVFPEQNYPSLNARQTAASVIGQGVSQGAAAGVGAAAGAAGAALRPYAAKVGGQLGEITTGIPAKYGEAMLNDTGVLARGLIPNRVRDAYTAFESQLGLTSPRLTRELAGKEMNSSTANASMKSADELLSPYIDYNASKSAGRVVYDQNKIVADINNGTLQPRYLAQNLYEGSQGARHLQGMAKAGSPQEIANQSTIASRKDTYDSVLESISPGYKDARTAAFEEKAADATRNYFPMNKNGDTNKLRGYGAIHGALVEGPIAAHLTGSPVPVAVGAAIPVLQSPRAFGAAVSFMGAAGKIPTGIYQLGTNTLSGGAASKLREAYLRNSQIGEPEPSFGIPGAMRPVTP